MNGHTKRQPRRDRHRRPGIAQCQSRHGKHAGLQRQDRADGIGIGEIKHKFPISRGRLTFGINDGELSLIGRLASAGIGCLHTVIVKPDWSKDRGSMYLVNDLGLKNRAAIIATTIDQDRVAGLLASTQYTSGRHTSFTGNTDVGYRVIPVSDFSRIGTLADPVDTLAGRIAGMMTGEDIPERATDDWLREMRARP